MSHPYDSPMDSTPYNDSMDQDFDHNLQAKEERDDQDDMLQDEFEELETTLMPGDENPGLERGGSGHGHGGKSLHTFSARGVLMGSGRGGGEKLSTTILHQDFKKRFKGAEMAMDPTFKVSSIA